MKPIKSPRASARARCSQSPCSARASTLSRRFHAGGADQRGHHRRDRQAAATAAFCTSIGSHRAPAPSTRVRTRTRCTRRWATRTSGCAWPHRLAARTLSTRDRCASVRRSRMSTCQPRSTQRRARRCWSCGLKPRTSRQEQFYLAYLDVDVIREGQGRARLPSISATATGSASATACRRPSKLPPKRCSAMVRYMLEPGRSRNRRPCRRPGRASRS